MVCAIVPVGTSIIIKSMDDLMMASPRKYEMQAFPSFIAPFSFTYVTARLPTRRVRRLARDHNMPAHKGRARRLKCKSAGLS